MELNAEAGDFIMKAIKFNYKARPKEHGLRVKMLSVRKKKRK